MPQLQRHNSIYCAQLNLHVVAVVLTCRQKKEEEMTEDERTKLTLQRKQSMDDDMVITSHPVIYTHLCTHIHTPNAHIRCIDSQCSISVLLPALR